MGGTRQIVMGAKDSDFQQDRMAVRKPEPWLGETLNVLPPALPRLTEALIALNSVTNRVFEDKESW